MLLRACIAVYLHTSKSCLFHIAPRRYLEKGGLKKSTPNPGDHFDFPCCGGVCYWPWYRTSLPCSLSTSDMGVSAGPTLWWSSHVTWWKIWLWTWHGHKEITLPVDLLLSPLVCSVKRVLGQRGRCPWGSTTVHVCCSAQGSAWYRAPPQICPWSVGFMQNLNSQTGMIFDPPLLSGRSQWINFTGCH